MKLNPAVHFETFQPGVLMYGKFVSFELIQDLKAIMGCELEDLRIFNARWKESGPQI